MTLIQDIGIHNTGLNSGFTNELNERLQRLAERIDIIEGNGRQPMRQQAPLNMNGNRITGCSHSKEGRICPRYELEGAGALPMDGAHRFKRPIIVEGDLQIVRQSGTGSALTKAEIQALIEDAVSTATATTTDKYTTSASLTGGPSSVTITHNLGTTDVVCAVYDSGGVEIGVTKTVTGANALDLSYNGSPGTCDVVVIG